MPKGWSPAISNPRDRGYFNVQMRRSVSSLAKSSDMELFMRPRWRSDKSTSIAQSKTTRSKMSREDTRLDE